MDSHRSMTSNLSHPKYRPDIDGLRAVAVLSVVIFHAFPKFLQGGFIGVDVFFVISGFLISTIIFKSLDLGVFSAQEFYKRRIKRIFPALLVVLVTSYVVGWYVLLSDEYAQLGSHIASGAGFVSNFTLLSESGYFDNSAETKPLLHLWSLGIEEQFYIVWPLLLIAAWKKKFNLLVLAALFTILSFYLNLVGVDKDATAAFYSPHTRFWELLCGSMLAWVSQYKSATLHEIKSRIDSRFLSMLSTGKEAPSFSLVSNLQSVLGVALLILGFMFISKDVGFPGSWAAIPVVGAVMLIAAGPGAWFNRTILSSKLLVWVGLISFPLYLWHWPVLTFARIVNGDVPDVGTRIAAVILSIAFASLTYRFVERPVRTGGGGNCKVYALAALMASVGGVGFLTYKNDGLAFRAFPQEVAQRLGTVTDYKQTLTIYGLGKCFIDYEQGADDLVKEQCVTPNVEGRRLVVYGDSEAAHLMSGVRKIYADSEFTVQQWTGTSCRPFAYVDNADSRCAEFSDRFVKSVMPELKSGDVVIVGANWFGSHYSLGGAVFESTVEQLFKDMSGGPARVVIFGNTPDITVDPIKTIARKISYSHEKQYLPAQDYQQSNLILEKLSEKYGFEYFNPSSTLCLEESLLECLVYDGKHMLFFDGGHLSGFGSDLVLEGFSRRIDIMKNDLAERSTAASLR